MKKLLYYIPAVLLFGLMLAACDTTDPEPVGETGGIKVQSTPAGAQIWLGSQNTNKVTPDSVGNLEVGIYSITLKLAGYRDTTITGINVRKDLYSSISVTLTPDVNVTKYGPVKLWESVGTSADQPSGLDLSTGLPSGIGTSNPDRNKVDLYYDGNTFVIKRLSNGRNTSFLVGSSTNLNDGTDSPLATSSWASEFADDVDNYVFVFDADSHYSKLKIVNRGGGTPGNPAWVEVEWYYGNNTNDVKF